MTFLCIPYSASTESDSLPVENERKRNNPSLQQASPNSGLNVSQDEDRARNVHGFEASRF